MAGTTTTTDTGKKRSRKLMVNYINAAAPGETELFERLGKDLEEYNKEMNYETEDKENILGEVSVDIYGAKPTADVDPFYAREGSALAERIQNIVDQRLELDDLKSSVVEVHLWKKSGDSGSAYEAVKESCWIEVTSIGGDTTGYQTPFTIHYAGDPVMGTFDINTKTFTAGSNAGA